MTEIVPASLASTRRTTLIPFDQLCSITDIGRVRDHNEDLVHLCGDGRVMIVADGMGGHAAGEVASALAIAAIVEYLGALLPSLADYDSAALQQAMRAAMDRAQERVLTAAQSHEGQHGMGCTLILACIRGDTFYTCHVGDVRGYLWRGQEFRGLTCDHSVVAKLIAAGDLTPDQARGHPARNQVLQAIGMPVGFGPDINTCRLEPGDRVLLCSDGLWEMLSDQEIAGIVGGDGSMRQIVTQLVDRANDSGGHDNISVVLYEHTARGKGSAAENRVTEAPSGKSA
ncbi:MAG: Stp1/IreP family PP2C-type Ser/Thr phosphatase [Methylococcaceae bacterium]|nr:Stp1/IreP family PP2C-type Ser/Thr phosphatase [Methylococcaceae bacterium]